jgi:hypothetical protein
MSDELLSVCEIAVKLGRSESYVWAMRRKGFCMTGGRATISEVRYFLKTCPFPLGNKKK